MKSIWNSLIVAFAMYSKIPTPRADWTKENMKYSFCFFPLIGAVIGALMVLAAQAGSRFGYTGTFIAAVLIFIPILITGGIHMDGLLDTSDALSSWQERTRRLEILKDSNAGAFAVIIAGLYYLVLYGSYTQIYSNRKLMIIMGLSFVVSRCYSGFAVVTYPKARKDGTAAVFARNAQNRPVQITLILVLLLADAAQIILSPIHGTAVALVTLLLAIYHHSMIMKNFGGMTGDLAGYLSSMCEVLTAATLALLSIL